MGTLMDYKPIFQVTSSIIKNLWKIEAVKEIVETLVIPIALEESFRKEASTKATHYSTKIEGNRLTLKQTKELLMGKDIVAREIDKREVMNYYNCLEWIGKGSTPKDLISEKTIKQLHGMIQKGIVKGKLLGEYREAQNAIFDSITRKAVYFPPEVKDVGVLMKGLVKWLGEKTDVPAILKAGVAHYQLVTIHPFMDGNGRTARALATLILYRGKYDLKGFYSLEGYYAEDLKGYYNALHECQGVHYYDNPNPDITPWLDYFVKGAAIVFEEVKEKVLDLNKKTVSKPGLKDVKLLEAVGPREKRLLTYFHNYLQLRTKDLCGIFHVKDRTARDMLAKWVKEGFILKRGSGKKDAYYVLSENYRRLIGG
jgi:Fic family protein